MKKRFEFPIYLLILFLTILIVATGCKKEEDDPIIKDGDGNIYTSVTIGTQVWLGQNLRTTKLNDGTAIPLVTDNTEWKDLTSSAYCWYGNNEAANGNVYGALYNWHAVNTLKLCPIGWHIPDNDEIDILVSYLGDYSEVGGKLKEKGNVHWNSPNTGATDDYGFTALPGGYRNYFTGFADLKTTGAWWNSTENNSTAAYINILYYDSAAIAENLSGVNKKNGYSVRCVKN